ncbi:DUF934 domain-containing protein [Rhizobium sp. L1K21]|uniref:DUF934 domain-containing protein n=1 Tax=Rhizobium sp. L1K21 TaxID=2954933 RepID=UPI002092792E|nr:DUF934 domain-containing protein [Rhizobium sp. L1K21]MCO6185896.1 DUF934 domain-containing protein [Rhizobium sp. L1K21]
MTKIWKESGFVEGDNWVVETDEVSASEGERALLGLPQFIEKAENSNDVGLGVLIRPADDVRELMPFIDRIALVAVDFPAFNDGRAFGHASLLRERLQYKGEIRAIGDVLIDQIPLMLRCGIDSFAVKNETALKRLEEGRLPGISRHYQPAAGRETAEGGYSWRRKARSVA